MLPFERRRWSLASRSVASAFHSQSAESERPRIPSAQSGKRSLVEPVFSNAPEDALARLCVPNVTTRWQGHAKNPITSVYRSKRGRALGEGHCASSVTSYCVTLLLLVVGGSLGLAQHVYAQATTSLTVRAVDQSGALLPGVTITVRTADGSVRSGITDPTGTSIIHDLKPGRISIEATLQGFQVVRHDLQLRVGAVQSVNLEFSVGGISEPVSVNAEVRDVRWNAWLERPGAPYAPVRPIVPGTDYDLVVHLAGVDYRAGNVASRTVSRSLGEQLQEWLDEHPDLIESKMTALLVPDARAIRVIGEASATLTVSLKKLRAFIESPPEHSPADVMSELRANAEPDYVFGKLRFNLAIDPEFEGMTSVALSIWHGMRPVDEIVLSFCIARDVRSRRCASSAAIAHSLNGIDAARLSTDPDSATPDLALHFIDLPGRQVVGVLRYREWPAGKFLTWPLQVAAAQFKRRLDDLAREIGETQEEESRRRIGLALYSLLFPVPSARDARAEFELLLRPIKAAGLPFASDDPPVLFVRSVMGGHDEAPFVPAGFLYPPSLQAFVGYYVRTEMPLPLQSYEASTTCIDRWVFLVPAHATDNNLMTAWSHLAEPSAKWRAAGARVFDEVSDFADWIGTDADDDLPEAIGVLSHHEQNAIRFDPGQALFAENISRRLTGSIAILSACGSSPPGQGAVVSQLNRNGVIAVIGTLTKVTPRFGAEMLQVLATAGESRMRTVATPLAVVFRRAQKVLFEKSTEEGYPPSDVLSYTLLGHSGVRVCTASSNH